MPTDPLPCNSTYFKCTKAVPECIPFSWVCDGEKECFDGSDEDKNICGKVNLIRIQILRGPTRFYTGN